MIMSEQSSAVIEASARRWSEGQERRERAERQRSAEAAERSDREKAQREAERRRLYEADERRPVSLGAIIARVNRKLAQDGEKLRTARSQAERTEVHMGHYYVIDIDRNAVLRGNIDPEALARELGVMSSAEKVAQEF